MNGRDVIAVRGNRHILKHRRWSKYVWSPGSALLAKSLHRLESFKPFSKQNKNYVNIYHDSLDFGNDIRGVRVFFNTPAEIDREFFDFVNTFV